MYKRRSTLFFLIFPDIIGMPKKNTSKEQLVLDFANNEAAPYIRVVDGAYVLAVEDMASAVLTSEWLDYTRQEIVEATAQRAAEIAGKFRVFDAEIAERIRQAILSDFGIDDVESLNGLDEILDEE